MMVNGEKERVSLLFMKALVSAGSIDAVSQQMASHPQYLESFLRTQHYILHMDGPLPLPCRHYIAIMVSEPPGLFLSRNKEHFKVNVAVVGTNIPTTRTLLAQMVSSLHFLRGLCVFSGFQKHT